VDNEGSAGESRRSFLTQTRVAQLSHVSHSRHWRISFYLPISPNWHILTAGTRCLPSRLAAVR